MTAEMSLDDVADELRRGSRVLLMVRHAERTKIDNEDPTFGEALPLTEEGVRTSRLFGERLREFAADVQFMASPLLRTRQTAATIAEGMGAKGADIPTDPRLGNSSFYFEDQREVFELFRGGSFFGEIFKYMAEGVNRGFRDIYEASDALERWVEEVFTAKLGVFATHDLYDAAFLYARDAKRDWTRENWVRFLDSAAIVFRPDGSRHYALVRSGLSFGTTGVAEQRIKPAAQA